MAAPNSFSVGTHRCPVVAWGVAGEYPAKTEGICYGIAGVMPRRECLVVWKKHALRDLVDVGGLEPPTPCLQSRCSPS